VVQSVFVLVLVRHRRRLVDVILGLENSSGAWARLPLLVALEGLPELLVVARASVRPLLVPGRQAGPFFLLHARILLLLLLLLLLLGGSGSL